MHPAYTLSVEKTGPSSSYLDSVFLKCLVTKTQAPFHKRVFIYCLHCLRLASPSWFDSHKRQVVFDLSPEAIERHRNRFTQYVDDVTTEVEFLYDSGKLFKESKSTPVPRRAKEQVFNFRTFQLFLKCGDLNKYSPHIWILMMMTKVMSGALKKTLSKGQLSVFVSVLKRCVLSMGSLTSMHFSASHKHFSNKTFSRVHLIAALSPSSKASSHRS